MQETREEEDKLKEKAKELRETKIEPRLHKFQAYS